MQRKIIISLLCLITSICYPADICFGEINIDTSSPFLHSDSFKRISMDFQEASLVDVLKIFSQQTQLNLVTAENIAHNHITVYLDNVPVEQALEQVLRANNLTYELQPNSDIYIVKPLIKPDFELITRVYHLKHASVSKAKIKQTLKIKSEDSPIGINEDSQKVGLLAAIIGVLTDKGKVVEDPRTNSLIVTDIITNFPNIEHTIARLDVPVPQILIELEMLDVSKQTADLIGIKYGNTPLAFTGGERDGSFPFDGSVPFFDDAGARTFVDPRGRVSTMDASGLTAAMQYLRTQTDTKTLARPHILTLDNETAQIKIATNEAISPDSTETSTGEIPTATTGAERVDTGVILTVTPQANLLTDEITLAVVPKVIVAKTGATFDGNTFKDPEERGTKSILRVHSGETIVIGGLLRTDDSTVITKVPLLGDLPLIGSMFRHKDKTIADRELIIFITPHILKDTPVQKTAAINQTIIREQDRPLDRLNEVEKELSIIEKQEL